MGLKVIQQTINYSAHVKYHNKTSPPSLFVSLITQTSMSG